MSSHPTPEELERIERAKRASVAQLLFKCARLVNERALERVRQRSGLEALRASHTALFPHIDFEGTRLTELARRLGISKQAVGQLVGELEAMGTLERVPDPSDGRAKLIRFSAQGRRGMLQGLSVLKELEVDYARDIGVERMEALRDALVALEEVLDLEGRSKG